MCRESDAHWLFLCTIHHKITSGQIHDSKCKDIKNQHVHPAASNFVHWLSRYASTIICYCIMLLQLLHRWQHQSQKLWLYVAHTLSCTLYFYRCFQHHVYVTSTKQITEGWQICKDSEGSSQGLNEILPRHFPGGLRKAMVTLRKVGCYSQDLYQAPKACKSTEFLWTSLFSIECTGEYIVRWKILIEKIADLTPTFELWQSKEQDMTMNILS
jgi:hypothetical protein